MNHSVLDAAGPAAQAISGIGWLLFIGGGLIFIAVMALLGWAVRRRPQGLRAKAWIIGGGIVFPGVVLTALFAYALPLSPVWRPVPPPGALVVQVTAHMWWWEVRYPATGGTAEVATANEIHIPVGRPVYLALASSDVIHSFWVPALAGKMDMVPGRMQHLLLSADKPGVYRGQCAEFCGEQHALMALHVVAQEPAAFDAWRQAQAQPTISAQARGQQAFMENRCNACHTVRGVTGESRLGPDLTHVGSRLHIAAGTLPNGTASLAHWVAHVQEVKTGARMPSYGHLDAQTLAAIGDWLGALK
jgi:cytochrome c oxidase subunit 2